MTDPSGSIRRHVSACRQHFRINPKFFSWTRKWSNRWCKDVVRVTKGSCAAGFPPLQLRLAFRWQFHHLTFYYGARNTTWRKHILCRWRWTWATTTSSPAFVLTLKNDNWPWNNNIITASRWNMAAKQWMLSDDHLKRLSMDPVTRRLNPASAKQQWLYWTLKMSIFSSIYDLYLNFSSDNDVPVNKPGFVVAVRLLILVRLT